jgi:peptide/nickel transport system substrate-binding protein
MERSDEGQVPAARRGALDRRQFLQAIAATGAVAGVGGLLAACGSSGSNSGTTGISTARKRGGNLKVGLSGSSGADTLDPHAGLTYLDTSRAQSLYQPLVQLNSAAQNEYVLATEITPTKTTSEWIIRLRQGVTFHSGKELTADDVIYTFRRIKTGNTGGTSFSGGDSLGPMDLSGLKALDSHTVQVPFTSPYGSFLEQLAYWYYLYIIPDGFDPAAPGTKPNGTGPFV